jgi:hypothetical protein
VGKKINWAKGLQELSKSTDKTPNGEGWFTAIDFQKESGVGINRTYTLLKAGLQEKKLEKFQGTIYDEDHRQQVRKCWYRFVNSK